MGIYHEEVARLLSEQRGGSANYGFIVKRDHLDDTDIEVIGPSNIDPTVEERLLKGEGRCFKIYDDDQELYFSGRCIDLEADGDSLSEGSFGPLWDYGTPDSGATEIRYRMDNGTWQQL